MASNFPDPSLVNNTFSAAKVAAAGGVNFGPFFVGDWATLHIKYVCYDTNPPVGDTIINVAWLDNAPDGSPSSPPLIAIPSAIQSFVIPNKSNPTTLNIEDGLGYFAVPVLSPTLNIEVQCPAGSTHNFYLNVCTSASRMTGAPFLNNPFLWQILDGEFGDGTTGFIFPGPGAATQSMYLTQMNTEANLWVNGGTANPQVYIEEMVFDTTTPSSTVVQRILFHAQVPANGDVFTTLQLTGYKNRIRIFSPGAATVYASLTPKP